MECGIIDEVGGLDRALEILRELSSAGKSNRKKRSANSASSRKKNEKTTENKNKN